MRMTTPWEVRMRGDDRDEVGAMWSYVPMEQRIPAEHPLRVMRPMVDGVLRELSPRFGELYSRVGRPSIAPEKLLRALRGLLSDEHFTVDGTLVEAWASLKSFKRKDAPPALPDDPGNPTVDFHGERRSNTTHASTTDPDARLARKGKGQEAKLFYTGHVLMLGALDRDRRLTLGADKGYDTRDFVAAVRLLGVTPCRPEHRPSPPQRD